MAFTNIYDDTFPADTELANLIGSNLRQVRLDVQQRMAAISGLDASKPNFAGDAQPANWNGILFFATDTGQVYQFNNPSWTNVTASLLGGQRMIGGNLALGTTVNASSTIYAGLTQLALSSLTPEATMQVPLSAAGTFRALYVNTLGGQPATGSLVFNLRLGGVSQAIQVTIPAGSAAGVYSDTAHTVNFTAGQLITLQIINNATSASAGLGSFLLAY